MRRSAIGIINDLVQEKKRAGERVYNLSIGEAILPLPPVLIEAACDFIKKGEVRYAPIAGLPELRQAAADWMNKTYGTDYSAAQTLVTCGGKFGLYLLCQTLLAPGDEALVMAPYWTSYPEIISLSGAAVKIIPTSAERGWKAAAEDIARAASGKTKLLILNSACNPTGVVYGRGELAAILTVAREKNMFVISDEVYSGLTYEGEYVSCGSFPEYRERVIIVQSCSKNFAMTGWRVGFVFAPEGIPERLISLQSQTITGTSTVSQAAAIATLAHAGSLMSEVRGKMKARRDVFVSEFNRLFPDPITLPQSGLYAFVPLYVFGVQGANDMDFCQKVLEKAGVAMVPGSAFGQAGWARCSFGAPEEEIRAALQALTKNIGLL